jgi:hypothetical protein
VAHSQHNGLLAAESRCNEEKNRNERKDGEKNGSTGRSIGASPIRKTDNGYEGCGETSSIKETIVSNTDNIRFERDQQTTETASGRRTEATFKSSGEDVSNTENWIGQSTERQGRESIRRGSDDRIWSKGKRENIKTDVSNSNPRLSIGENEEVQTRRDTFATSGKDVSNTDSIRHRRWSSEGCTNKGWSFLQRKQEGREMGSETQRCDGDVSNTDSERLQGHGLSTNMETKQGSIGSENSVEEQQTWWQTESNLCGVPNGISYELDKNRANRIKTLGNAIVPQIAREFGLAIKKVLSDSDSNGQGG